jgi:hypothetical protein
VIPDIEALGFTTVQHFQQAWNLGNPLVVDGIAGPITRTAAAKSMLLHRAGQPDISPNFAVHEFACHCGGRLPGCQVVLIHYQLLRSLETQRRFFKHPVGVVDGYRCPEHNKAVGGVPDSEHELGLAADLSTPETEKDLRGLGVYAGLGVNGPRRKVRPGCVSHVDRRDLNPHDPTGGTPTRPTIWFYN